ncbi:MAG: hypothetical protein E7I57_01725 [Anaerococcus vaginalis]|uniref:hypothetical protein n=1 Tax=Anaerococcus vaginalis TaxID=33037 RepID=UPI0029062C23|nr:hypothetical protein [Anaerococcus vaginalis]MDU4378147.1 hypothetical protein [Anaerococcus vaginalis]
MKSLSEQLKEILEDETLETRKKIEEIADQSSEYGLKLIKKRSPRDRNRKSNRTGKKRYASGWRDEKEYVGGSITKHTLHNVNEPTLTHLLENGHVVKNQFGTYGRAEAIPHIERTEKDTADYFEQNVIRKLEK